MIQTVLMGQYVLLHPKSNSQLQMPLNGTPFRQLFYCTSWDDLASSLGCFKHLNAVYVRFSHIANFQPKFYLGSTSSFVLCREHSRYRKFLQVQQNKFVLAEVALRFWCRYDNFWMWSVLPIYTNKSNFWALEQALFQLWQPRLNTPLIYQFFSCRKGFIARSKCSSSRQFGTFSLWRRAQTSFGLPTHNMFDEPFTVLFSTDAYNFGKLSRIRAATPSGASTWRKNSDLTKLACKDATSFDA